MAFDKMKIYEFLKNVTDSNHLPNTFSRKEWNFRCILCGDSKKHSGKGHLYVNNELWLYHCFKCDSASSVFSLLKNLSYSDLSDLEFIKKEQRDLKYTHPSYNILNIRKHNYNIEYVNKEKKEKYFKERLGNDFDVSGNMQQFKIILDIKQFMKENNLTSINADEKKLDWLSKSFVGFGCYRGAKVVLRNIEDSKIRYFVVKFFDEIDSYIFLPDKISQTEIFKRNQLVLSEGIFDILKSYTTNILHLKDTTSAYCSVLSKAYVSTHWFSRLVLSLPSPKSILLLDNDMNISKKVKGLLINDKLQMYKNSKGKDFGTNEVSPILLA